MQQHIPDDLGQEVAKLAEGLKLDMDQAVRDALETWIERVRKGHSQRMPDACFMTDEISAPFDLPRSEARPVKVIKGEPRMPDGVGLE